MHHHEPLLRILAHRKGRAATWTKRRMTLLHRIFDILRIDVAPGDNDQIFNPPGDEQLSLVEKTEIACAQVGTAAIRKLRLKRLCSLFRSVPVATRYARTCNPDLAHLPGSAAQVRLRIDNGDFV